LEALPAEAQVSPIFAIVAEDVNNDGIMDILLFGNIYGLKPEVGRLDANKGVYCLG
jgi:enediyne biosynthesis protein E4